MLVPSGWPTSRCQYWYLLQRQIGLGNRKGSRESISQRDVENGVIKMRLSHCDRTLYSLCKYDHWSENVFPHLISRNIYAGCSLTLDNARLEKCCPLKWSTRLHAHLPTSQLDRLSVEVIHWPQNRVCSSIQVQSTSTWLGLELYSIFCLLNSHLC